MSRKLHIVVDFSFLYYKYYFRLNNEKAGKTLPRLSCLLDGQEVDTTYRYYIGKEIESFRETFENDFDDIIISICFDSKSERKNEDADYKANRHSKLTQSDFGNMDDIRYFFEELGYNVYKEEGKEADDLVYSLAQKYKYDFDFTVIYTPDKDLLVNVCDNVGVMRGNTYKNTYDAVSKKNYRQYLSEKFKSDVPYNSVLLYLSMVGDSVDGIKGIKGFGSKAFSKFVDTIWADGVVFENLCDADYVEEVIRKYKDVYSGKNIDAMEQALKSLEMAKPRMVDVSKPSQNSSTAKRNEVYKVYKMTSLVKFN